MATQVGSIYVSLAADFAAYEAGLGRAASVTTRETERMRSAASLTARSVSTLEKSFSNVQLRPYQIIAASRAFEDLNSRVGLLRGVMFGLTAAFGGFGAALTSNVIARYADTFTQLNNAVRSTSSSSAEAVASVQGIARAAEASRASLTSTGTLFARIQKALPDLNAADTLRYVETIQKALQLGGASAQEAASAAIQFSQALASDRLQGEELRAILETPLGNELARGLGVTIGKLREMGTAGELTAKTVLGGLASAGPEIDKRFAQSAKTIDQALTVADNKLTLYFGSVDQAYGGTRLLAEAITSIGDNLKTIIPLLATAGLSIGAIFASRLFSGAAGRVGAGIGAITEQVNARKEALTIAKEEAALSQRSLAEAKQARSALTLNRAVGGEAKYANVADVKAYQREVEKIARLDAQRIDLLQRQQELGANTVRQLAVISKDISPRSASAAERQVKAETALNEALARQSQLRKEIRAVDTLQTTTAGLQSTNVGRLSAVAEAERRRATLEREALAVSQQIAKQRSAIAESQATIAAIASRAEAEATNKRIDILRGEAKARAQLNKEIVSNEAARQTQLKAVQGAASTTSAGSQANYTRAIREADAEVFRLAGSASASAAKVAQLTQQTTFLASAMSVLRSAGGSLVAFLGGPWGVAFLAAAGAAAYLASSMAKSAADVARQRGVISEEIAKLAADPGADPRARERAQLSLNDDKINAEKARLQDARDAIVRIRSELAETAQSIGGPIFRDGAASAATLQNAFSGLIKSLNDGTITVDQFKQKVGEIGLPIPIVAKLAPEIDKASVAANQAQDAIGRILSQVNALDGAKATITIAVNTDILTQQLPKLPNYDDTSREIQQALAPLMEIGRARKLQSSLNAEVLRAGGDKEQAIKDRVEALKKEYAAEGITQEQAEKTARAEAKAAESKKAAAAASRGAASEAKKYLTLQEAIARIQEQGRGAFLGEVDRAVLDQAKNLKLAAGAMDQYIKAVESGDLSSAPKETLALREAITAKKAAESYRELIKVYGYGSDLTDSFKQKQAELTFLVDKGRITAAQASAAMADYAMSFSSIQTPISLASDFTKTFVQGMMDGKSATEALSDSLKNLSARLLDLAVDAMFKQILGSLLGGGGPLNLGAAVAARPFHDGGIVGAGGGLARLMSAGAFSAAPRYHSGFLPGELPAILKRGEAVLNDRLTGRMSRTMNGLVSRVSNDNFQRSNNLNATIDLKGANGDKAIEQAVARGVASAVQISRDQFRTNLRTERLRTRS